MLIAGLCRLIGEGEPGQSPSASCCAIPSPPADMTLEVSAVGSSWAYVLEAGSLPESNEPELESESEPEPSPESEDEPSGEAEEARSWLS